jgi:hypothetical protein
MRFLVKLPASVIRIGILDFLTNQKGSEKYTHINRNGASSPIHPKVCKMKKPEYPERTTDHGQATGKLYHLRL